MCSLITHQLPIVFALWCACWIVCSDPVHIDFRASCTRRTTQIFLNTIRMIDTFLCSPFALCQCSIYSIEYSAENWLLIREKAYGAHHVCQAQNSLDISCSMWRAFSEQLKFQCLKTASKKIVFSITVILDYCSEFKMQNAKLRIGARINRSILFPEFGFDVYLRDFD